MDANELKATIARLDDMRARCDAVIARDKPLQPDRTVGRKRLRSDYVAAKNTPINTPNNPPVASGQLAGREMRARPGYRPQKPTFVDDWAQEMKGYHWSRLRRSLPSDMDDGSIESIFADFEAQFDEMAQAHRG